jgi:hypothetical protein
MSTSYRQCQPRTDNVNRAAPTKGGIPIPGPSLWACGHFALAFSWRRLTVFEHREADDVGVPGHVGECPPPVDPDEQGHCSRCERRVHTHDEIADHLEACRSRWGISYFSVRDLEGFAPVIHRLGDN